MRGWFWIIGIGTLVLALSSIVTALYGLGFAGRTLFEWMDILIVPIAVGIGVYLLEQSQRSREQNEQRRREEERERAVALEEYLHQMGEALVEYGLSRAKQYDEQALLARARTLSVLGILDPVRKGQVVSFLSGANLINRNRPIVVLAGADLDGAFLRNHSIRENYLAGTHLREATLIAADLYGANLREADLGGADLSDADLSDADLSEANLSGASLFEAALNGANLTGASLSDADLSGANLTGASLNWADLSGANLTGAIGISNEEVEQEAYSLKGATMPDGSKHR